MVCQNQIDSTNISGLANVICLDFTSLISVTGGFNSLSIRLLMMSIYFSSFSIKIYLRSVCIAATAKDPDPPKQSSTTSPGSVQCKIMFFNKSTGLGVI